MGMIQRGAQLKAAGDRQLQIPYCKAGAERGIGNVVDRGWLGDGWEWDRGAMAAGGTGGSHIIQHLQLRSSVRPVTIIR